MAIIQLCQSTWIDLVPMDSCVREQADDVTNDSELFKILLNHIEHQIKYPQQEVIMWLYDGGVTSHVALHDT